MDSNFNKIDYNALKSVRNKLDSNFDTNNWSDTFYISPTDPIKVASSLLEELNNNVIDGEAFQVPKEQPEDKKVMVYILKDDYSIIVNLISDLLCQNNWDVNRKIYLGGSYISIDIFRSKRIINEYLDYYSEMC